MLSLLNSFRRGFPQLYFKLKGTQIFTVSLLLLYYKIKMEGKFSQRAKINA